MQIKISTSSSSKIRVFALILIFLALFFFVGMVRNASSEECPHPAGTKWEFAFEQDHKGWVCNYPPNNWCNGTRVSCVPSVSNMYIFEYSNCGEPDYNGFIHCDGHTTAYTLVIDNCYDKRQALIEQCSGDGNVDWSAWDDSTCSGQCKPPCSGQGEDTLEEAIANCLPSSLAFYDEEKCMGICSGPNLGSQCQL